MDALPSIQPLAGILTDGGVDSTHDENTTD